MLAPALALARSVGGSPVDSPPARHVRRRLVEASSAERSSARSGELRLEPLLLGAARRARPRLGVRLGEDRLGLAARLLAQLLRRALSRDERRPQQSFELLVADEVELELLDLVGEVGALAPDVLEALGDLDEQRVDRVRACSRGRRGRA